VQLALASRQSLREIQTWWTDEDIVTALQELDDQADEQSRRG
jgi:hypothetical protein